MNKLFTLVSFAAAVMVSGSILSAADPEGAASSADLIARFSQARTAKDANAYALLVCWDRVSAADRKSLLEGFTEEARNTATDVRLLTPEQMDQEVVKAGGRPPTRTPLMRAGVAWDFNLPVAGYLVYNSRGADGSHGMGAVPVGLKGGRYFVITRAPVAAR